jgi:hypothetical protein
MKDIISFVRDIFMQNDLKLLEINLKLTTKGQIEYCTGQLSRQLSIEEAGSLEKYYRKNVSSNEYRFLNTSLSVTGNNFSITNNRK